MLNGNRIRRVLAISDNTQLLLTGPFRLQMASFGFEIRLYTDHAPQSRRVLKLEYTELFWGSLGISSGPAEVVVVIHDENKKIAPAPAGVSLKTIYLPAGDIAPVDPFEPNDTQSEWLPQQATIINAILESLEPVSA